MKVVICLLSILHSVMGGAMPPWMSGPTTMYEIVEPQGVHGNSGVNQQVSKVILIDAGKSHGYGSDHSYPDVHSQLYKIQELGQGSRAYYGSRHSHNSKGVTSTLNALLPQILKIIFESNDSGNHQGINSQLISAYDHKGSASVTRRKGQPNHDLKGGHVIQKGTLEVTRTISYGGFGGKLGGGKSW